MMKIKEINWLSKEALEAEVVITDGQFELLCFSHPFSHKIGDVLKEPLQALDVKNVSKADTESFYAQKLPDSFEYLLQGKLTDKQNGILSIGSIEIESDSPVPQDLEEGDFISLQCDRLDI